jgi:5-methylthioadenosine/S-adenosylhomocysteine deaminase
MTPAPCDLLVTHGVVLTMDDGGTVIEDGAVAVRGHDIVAVGSTAEVAAAWRGAKTVDAMGGIVHPGFIDGHTHLGLHLMRGLLPEDPGAPAPPGPGPFARWLNALTEEDEAAATALAALEMMMAGFTGVVEAGTALYPDAVAETMTDAGLRVSLADPMLWDHPGIEVMATQIAAAPCDAGRARADLGRQLRRNGGGGLARGHVAVYGDGSASAELMQEASRLAAREGVPFHMHQSFTHADAEADAARLGAPALVAMAERGIIGPHAVFTHMNVLTDAEAEAVAQSGMAIVWHPGNAAFYGIQPRAKLHAPALVRRGTEIALSADVAKAWSFGDLGRFAYIAAREWGDWLSSAAILRMHTRGGARAMGMSASLGLLAPGRRADVVVRRADDPLMSPGFDPALHLALLLGNRGVRTVVCNGAVVLDDGEPLTIDRAEVMSRARASAQRMAARAGLLPGSAP